jgi:hypothetical protein
LKELYLDQLQCLEAAVAVEQELLDLLLLAELVELVEMV